MATDESEVTRSSDRINRLREASVTQVSLPDLNTMIAPMSSLTVKRSLTTGEYTYELKMYFDDPQEAIAPHTLDLVKDFDTDFYSRFPKPEPKEPKSVDNEPKSKGRPKHKDKGEVTSSDIVSDGERGGQVDLPVSSRPTDVAWQSFLDRKGGSGT